MPSNGNYQQNIVLRRTPPSAESLSEGQIVFALAPNRGMSMYTKRNGQVWISPFYKQQEKQIINELEVKNSAKFLRDINVVGNVYGKQTLIFCHNFADDMGTTKHYLPWGDQVESSSPTSTAGIAGFLAPYDMTLKKIQFRSDLVNQQADITFKVERVDSGDSTADEIASAEFDATIAADTMHELSRSDFNNNPKVVSGSMAALSIQADTDFNLAGVSATIFITSVWEVDIVI